MKTRKLYEHEILTTYYKSFKMSRQNTMRNALRRYCYVSIYILISKYWNQFTMKITICTPAYNISRHPNIQWAHDLEFIVKHILQDVSVGAVFAPTPRGSEAGKRVAVLVQYHETRQACEYSPCATVTTINPVTCLQGSRDTRLCKASNVNSRYRQMQRQPWRSSELGGGQGQRR